MKVEFDIEPTRVPQSYIGSLNITVSDIHGLTHPLVNL